MTEQCGTPAYIAPEILKDKGYTFSVDIWSAGVVLFAMLYGTVPFKANNMDELHKLIVKGKYTLKDDISIEARNLLRGLLEVNPEKRLNIKQIYRHKWLDDIDTDLQLFNELERDMIRKEYTYNDPRRYNRNENEEPVDCFTEHHLESVYNSLQNVTSKSIILAPFNSTQSQIDSMLVETIHKNLCEKMMVLKFARRCREIDRQYEFNNNGELDNGVYHKFVYNSDDGGDDGDGKDDESEANNRDLLSVPMLLSERKPARGGRSSVENSFEND
jgi:serine/threonine protein kinase